MEDKLERDIKVELEDLLQALGEERYLQLSGLKIESGSRSLLEGHTATLDPAGWGELLSGLNEASRVLVGGSLLQVYIELAMAGPLDSMLESETAMSLRVPADGLPVNLRRAPMTIACLEDRATRADAHLRWTVACDPLAGSCEAALTSASIAAGTLGFGSLADLLQRALGLELEDVRKQADLLIDATTDIYGDILSWLVKNKCGVALDLAEEHDILWLAGPAGPAPPVSLDATHGGVMKVTQVLGLGDVVGGNLVLDLESRERGIVWPFMVPLRVPGRLIVFGGSTDSLFYSKLLAHELGRALSYSHMARELAFEERCLIDPALPHAWGYLFDGIYLDVKWIDSLGGGRLRNDWLPLGGALDLLRHRMDAALAGALVPGDGEFSLAGYVLRQESAQIVKSSGIFLFRNLGDLTDPIHRVRGITLGLALREYFRDRFGEDWYNNAEAGALMLSLWRSGGAMSAESLAGELDLDSPDSGTLVAETERALGRWQ